MKPSKLDSPAITEKIVQHLAAGQSQDSIAEQLGVNQSSISRFVSREEIKTLIEQEQRRLLDVVPDAVDNVKTLVKEMKDISPDDIKRRELSYKASRDVLKSVGLMPTPVQSQVFVNLYQDNQTIISPLVMEILNRITETTSISDIDIEED